MTEVRFTPTQQAMLQVLSDGMPHRKEDLYACLPEGYYSDMKAVVNMVSKMRKKLQPLGQDVICEYRYGVYMYRHVRLLHSANDGYR